MGKIRTKGTGASYGPKIKQLSDLHQRILRILLAEGPLTKAQLTRLLNKEQKEDEEPFIGGFSISGRLSELCGAGLIKMSYEKIELYDAKSMQFRWKTKPLWRLTPLGSRYAMAGLIKIS